MTQCQWCSEEIGDANRCPSCGRIQYRYALDGATDDAIAATTASDAEQTRVDDLYGREDVLEDIAERLSEVSAPPPAPFPTLERRPPSPTRTPPAPKRVQRTTPTPTGAQQSRAMVGCFSLVFLIGLGVFLTLTIATTTSSTGGSPRSSIAAVLPVVIVSILVVRLLRRRSS